MKSNNRPKKQKVPDYIPYSQAEAAVKQAALTAAKYYTTLCGEHMIIMLHDEFGFGRDRCTKALAAYIKRLDAWADALEAEFDAETFGLKYKEKQEAQYELAHPWERHDQALEPLVYGFVPYTERFGFVGEGKWKR